MDRSIHLDIRASEIDNMEGDGAFVFWQGTSAENMYDLVHHRTSIVLSMEGFCGRGVTCRRTGSGIATTGRAFVPSGMGRASLELDYKANQEKKIGLHSLDAGEERFLE